MNIDPNFASFIAQFIGTAWSIFIGKTISEIVMEWRTRRKSRSSSSHSGRQSKRVIIIRAALMLILTCTAITLYNSGIVSINLFSDKSAKIQSTAVQSTPPTKFHGKRSEHRKGRTAASSSSTPTVTPAPSPTQVPPTATSVVTPAPSPTQVPPTATPVVIPTLSPTPPAATPTPAPTPTAQGL